MVSYLQQKRREVVDKIVNTLRICKAQGLEVNKENLQFEIMQATGASRMKAAEYISDAEMILKREPEPEAVNIDKVLDDLKGDDGINTLSAG